MGYLPNCNDGWVTPVTIEVDQAQKSTLEAEMRRVLEVLNPELDLTTVEVKAANAVAAEWQGGTNDHKTSEKGKDNINSAATKNGPVILSLHGGGFFSGSASMERSVTIKCAQMINGRIFGVDYRLVPQNPFPAALLDALVAYVYLLDPPKGALHEPVDPKNLFIAGDSSGVEL